MVISLCFYKNPISLLDVKLSVFTSSKKLLLKKDNTKNIFIQAIDSQDSLKDKQELSLQVIESYQKKKNCALIVKLFVNNKL